MLYFLESLEFSELFLACNRLNSYLSQSLSIGEQMANTISELRKYISSLPAGDLFSTSQCLACNSGSRKSVDRALARMVSEGTLERLTRGIFVVSDRRRPQYSNLEIAKAKAKSFKKTILETFDDKDNQGLCNAATTKTEFLINSGYTRFLFNGEFISLNQKCAKKVLLSSSKIGQMILALWQNGRHDASVDEIAKAVARLNQTELREFVKLSELMPNWLATMTKEALGPKWSKIQKELRQKNFPRTQIRVTSKELFSADLIHERSV